MTSNSPKAFIVLGPESSGTRLLCRILINAGCEGSDEHYQELDDFTASHLGYACPVWRRSVPHYHQWLDLAELIDRLPGFDVHVLVSVRDQHCIEQSQLKVGHVKTLSEARQNISKAYVSIFDSIAFYGLSFTIVPHESLVLGGAQAQKALLRSLGLSVPDKFVVIRNENEKHFRDQNESGTTGNPPNNSSILHPPPSTNPKAEK